MFKDTGKGIIPLPSYRPPHNRDKLYVRNSPNTSIYVCNHIVLKALKVESIFNAFKRFFWYFERMLTKFRIVTCLSLAKLLLDLKNSQLIIPDIILTYITHCSHTQLFHCLSSGCNKNLDAWYWRF